MIISSLTLLSMRNVADKRCTENQNLHFMFNNFFFKSPQTRIQYDAYNTV
jgi:hypothetical protein